MMMVATTTAVWTVDVVTVSGRPRLTRFVFTIAAMLLWESCLCSSLCPAPPPVPNAVVTANLTTATYTCLEGYAPDTGDPTATCTEGNWTTPGLQCLKVCPPPPPVPNANVTVHLPTATYTCLEGYVPDTGDPTATCTAGQWSLSGFTCKVIECGPPPNISSATQAGGQSRSYNSRSYYQCHSGHVLSTDWGAQTNFSYVCSVRDGQPAWLAGFGDAPSSCRRSNDYEGCFPASEQLEATGTKGISGCKQLCRGLNKAYAALKGGQCACADAMLSEAVDNAECNQPCELSADKLCGSLGLDRWSVYTTFHGCFKNLSGNAGFRMLNEVTCQERCRGLGEKYAAFGASSSRCVCYSSIPVTAQPLSSCGSSEDNTTFIPNVSLLAKTPAPNVSTCEELFQQGVYLHGQYYLAGHTTPSLCNFYDNSTACGMGWYSHKGSCYAFPAGKSTFRAAFNSCLEQDSLLVAINSEDEDNFLHLYYNISKAVLGIERKNPFLGMYDAFKAFAHQWMDGSLMTYKNFFAQEPNTFGYQCAVILTSSAKQQWADRLCTSEQPFICERSTGVYGCIEHGKSGYTPVHTLNETLRMTLALCMETCRGRGAKYASVSGSVCECLTSLPAHQRVPWTQCGTPCTGNAYQLCGNPALTATNTVRSFVLQDVDRPYASSCRELEVQGVQGSNLTIQRNGNPVNVMCSNDTDASCPFSFVRLGGRCYKFFPMKAANPLSKCSVMNAYPVVLNSPEEEATVFGDPSMLGDSIMWSLGLYYYKGKGGLYRTGSGENSRGLRLPYNPSDTPVTCVLYNRQTKQISPGTCSNVATVCEKGSEFLGCGARPKTGLVLFDYPEISALQCVELCRGQSLRYTSILRFPNRCYCTPASPAISYPPGLCSAPCFGGVGMCGSGPHGYVGSVYDVDRFAPFANNCSDLFDADVMVPGTYMIGSQPTYCYMKDNSSCSLPEKYWEGVGENGTCIKFSMTTYDHGATFAATCKSLAAATHLPASIRSAEEMSFFVAVFYRMKSSLTRKNTHIGGVDEFELGTFTWADGWLMTYYPWFVSGGNIYPGLNYGNGDLRSWQFMTLHISGKFSNHKMTFPYSIICRETPEALGCFLLSPSMVPALANYSSMSIALCKQTCLALHLSLALLQDSSCYCASNASSLAMAPVQNATGCDVPCPGNRMQTCASGGFLRGYLTDWKDMAETCEVLHANFVLLYNTYLLRDNSTGVASPTACGLSDNSTCPPGFLGNKGRCYRFFPRTYKNATAAAEYCRSINSYLATPRDFGEITFLVTAIKGIPSLSTYVRWRLGVHHLSKSSLAVGSGGELLTSDPWNMTALPGNESCVTLNSQTSQLERTSPCSVGLPFVCQVGPAFQGCRNISSPLKASVTFDLSQSSRTVQQCVALCHGQDTRYALLTSTKCHCLNYDVTATGSDVVACPAKGCGDYSFQACGDDTGVYAVYDIEAYNETETEAQSCDQYREANVTAIGRYYINVPPPNKLPVTCGTHGNGHKDILTREGESAQYLASSTAVKSTPLDARLRMESVAWTAWRPLSNDSQPWIQVTLTDIYTVKALVLRGTVTVLKLSFTFSAENLQDYGRLLSGPSHSTEMAVKYLLVPVVAKVIRLQPTSWSGSPAMAFALLGERYSTFNHSDSYIGCFASPANSVLKMAFPGVKSAQLCRYVCRSNSFPFFGLRFIDDGAWCGCSHTIGQFGEVNGTLCNSTCVNLPCGNLATLSVALYRAYELTCPLRYNVTHANVTVTTLMTRTEDVTEVGSGVTWTCVRGMELKGVGSNMTASCLANLTWSATPPATCTAVQCGSPPNVSDAAVTVGNLTYGSEAVYLCSGGRETAEGLAFQRAVCSHTKQWRPAPPACQHPRATRDKTWRVSQHGYRLAGSPTALKARSRIECTRGCTSNNLCTAFSYCHNPSALPAGADNCLHHTDYLSKPTAALDSDWSVYSVVGGK